MSLDDRGTSQADRLARADGRDASEADRGSALDDRSAAASDRDTALDDRLASALDGKKASQEHAAMELEAAEAHRANAAKSEFLSRLSHELRTPLNAIIGFGQLLERAPLAPDDKEAVKQILYGGRHLLSLINDILDTSSIDAGRMVLSIETVDVGEVVQETLRLMSPAAVADGITLTLGADDHCAVLADRRRLKQVLMNLLSNAIKYNCPHGRVDITVSNIGASEVTIVVTDTGLGMSEENLPRLFEPFDRLGLESSPIEGAGIGLALTKSLVHLMSGRLDVDSVEGKGTAFTVTLFSAIRTKPSTATATLDAPTDQTQALTAGTHSTVL